MVQSLEPLNAVTIAHSGVPPFTKQLVEQFAECTCGAMLDLYIRYDKRALAEVSRNYTTFQTPSDQESGNFLMLLFFPYSALYCLMKFYKAL
jgi:hypothetical protein